MAMCLFVSFVCGVCTFCVGGVFCCSMSCACFVCVFRRQCLFVGVVCVRVLVCGCCVCWLVFVSLFCGLGVGFVVVGNVFVGLVCVACNTDGNVLCWCRLCVECVRFVWAVFFVALCRVRVSCARFVGNVCLLVWFVCVVLFVVVVVGNIFLLASFV